MDGTPYIFRSGAYLASLFIIQTDISVAIATVWPIPKYGPLGDCNLCYQACLTGVDILCFPPTIIDEPDYHVQIQTEPERKFGYLHSLSIKESTDGVVLGLKSQVF